jgi:hypothetical protein
VVLWPMILMCPIAVFRLWPMILMSPKTCIVTDDFVFPSSQSLWRPVISEFWGFFTPKELECRVATNFVAYSLQICSY